MKRAWQITCIAFVALSVFTIVLSFEYPYKDKLGPGPAFFPIWLSIITGALALALFFQTTWGGGVADAAAKLSPRAPRGLAHHHHSVRLIGMLGPSRTSGIPDQPFLVPSFPPAGARGGQLVGHSDIRRSRQLRDFSRLLLLAESTSAHGDVRYLRRGIWTRCNIGFRALP